MSTVFASFDFSSLGIDIPDEAGKQRLHQAHHRSRGILHMLDAAINSVETGTLTQRSLAASIASEFGYHPQFAWNMGRLMIGPNPTGHLFWLDNADGYLSLHPGRVGKILHS